MRSLTCQKYYGYKMVHHIYSDHTRVCLVYLSKEKLEAKSVLKNFHILRVF